jgi:hypothetical protein
MKFAEVGYGRSFCATSHFCPFDEKYLLRKKVGLTENVNTSKYCLLCVTGGGLFVTNSSPLEQHKAKCDDPHNAAPLIPLVVQPAYTEEKPAPAGKLTVLPGEVTLCFKTHAGIFPLWCSSALLRC